MQRLPQDKAAPPTAGCTMFGLLLAAYSSAQKAVDAEERTYDQGKHYLLQPGRVTIIHQSDQTTSPSIA